MVMITMIMTMTMTMTIAQGATYLQKQTNNQHTQGKSQGRASVSVPMMQNLQN